MPHRIATRQPYGFMSQPALCYNLLCDHGREIETFSANFSQFIAFSVFFITVDRLFGQIFLKLLPQVI